MEPIIQTERLSHIYSAGTPFEHGALVDVDFTAYRGEYLGIIGHTGSGKSTLIQHLNGLLKPTSGRVLFEGRDIWESKERTRQTRFQVGLVFQYPEYQLFEETIYKDIAFGPKNMGLDEGEVDRRVREAAQFVGLREDMLENPPLSCPADKSAGSPSPALLPWSPPCSYWTSPPPAWTQLAWRLFWATSTTITRPETPLSSSFPTPWRKWPGRWTGWW